MSPQTDEEETESSSAEQGDNVSYALIHEAESLTTYENLTDGDSLEAQVARARGKGSVTEVRTARDEGGDVENTTYTVDITEGRLNIDSGYVVRFIDEEHRDLNPFDVKALDSLRDYPAPETMVENLPPQVRGHLKEYGYVKVRGSYSAEQGRFYGVEMGWEEKQDVDPWDEIMRVIENVSSPTAALDYVFVEKGPDRWGAEEVAAVRGNEPGSVKSNVRSVANELDQE